MNFIDTHSHLYLKDFDLDIDEEIKTSIGLGIQEFYLPSIDSSYTNRMIKLKNKYPDEIKLMMGLHPTHIDTNCEKEIAHVKKMLDEENFSAVGEQREKEIDGILGSDILNEIKAKIDYENLSIDFP